MAKQIKVTTATQNFTKALKAGTLPMSNKTVRELSKFYGKRGQPLKRQLRSNKQKEEFNKLQKKYNKERPTLAKEKAKKQAIRKKQVETRKKNVSPRRAAAAVSDYEKLQDVIEMVGDEIAGYVSYALVQELIQDNPTMSARDIASFIISKYKDMQNNLPDFAKDRDTGKRLDKLEENLTTLIEETKTTNIDDLTRLGKLKASNPARYKRELAKRNKASKSRRAKGNTTSKSRRGKGKK